MSKMDQADDVDFCLPATGRTSIRTRTVVETNSLHHSHPGLEREE